MSIDPQKLRTVLVTDCGSTTTKALLFQKTQQGWRQTQRGEAPTTVEAPVADVTVGAVNAFTEISEISGRKLLAPASEHGAPFLPNNAADSEGIDLYLSTSSAGGGLQMMVTGVVREMTTESAQRAALGAGAIVLDAISADDGREDHERIERIRHLRPDIVLITGGIDGGSSTHVIEMAELLRAASPRPRFGDTLRLPVIYAGNNLVAEDVREILAPIADVSVVANVRPEINREQLIPAREAIHEFFLSHVMSHSPGYGKLLSWSPWPVMPTPAAVGDMVLSYARDSGQQVLCADIGGATTDVFSVFRDRGGQEVFTRTVSANLGMSYSMANVLVEAGSASIRRWIPAEISESDLRDRLRNKMIRPTSIPQTIEDLWLEQAVCREALRLSLSHHRSLAVGLSGVRQERGISDLFSQSENRYQLVDPLKLDLVIGSGGVLSHAPRRIEAAMMMLDGFELQGVTQIAVDSIFMLPHLGVLAAVHPQAAKEIFLHDCLVNVAHAIVPVWRPRAVSNREVLLATVSLAGCGTWQLFSGRLQAVFEAAGVSGELVVVPADRGIDVGAGPGGTLRREVKIGECGLILDGRGRPLVLPEDPKLCVSKQQESYRALGLEVRAKHE